MFFTLLRQWVMTPFENYRLFHHFTRQDFVAQFASSIGGFLWLFVTPIAHIIIYAFVFGYIFQLRALPEFGQTEFVIFMMIGYLPRVYKVDSYERLPDTARSRVREEDLLFER